MPETKISSTYIVFGTCIKSVPDYFRASKVEVKVE